jgi:hypothetical protein
MRTPLILSAFAALGLVATPQTAPPEHPDFSGFWELRPDSRNIPPASLTAWAAGLDKTAQAGKNLYAIRWCNHVGLPAMMDDSGPLDIRQGRYEIAIAGQSVSPGRHIYMDGRSQPSPDAFDPTTLGNSVGRWDNDALIVDTIGFNDKGITDIPGGGVRTPTSHLKEAWRLAAQGAHLEVTFTWTDPRVYASPHTYSFRYEKAPAGTRAHEWFCDPADAARAKFLLDPPQSR